MLFTTMSSYKVTEVLYTDDNKSKLYSLLKMVLKWTSIIYYFTYMN